VPQLDDSVTAQFICYRLNDSETTMVYRTSFNSLRADLASYPEPLRDYAAGASMLLATIEQVRAAVKDTALADAFRNAADDL